MTFVARRSFALKVDRERNAQGKLAFDLTLLLVKSRRVHGFLEHRVVKSTPQTVTYSEESALRAFVDLRDRIVQAGFPEFVGGHILGPLTDAAVAAGIPESGLTAQAEERHDRELRKRGEPILK
jgi:hypothetical protein